MAVSAGASSSSSHLVPGSPWGRTRSRPPPSRGPLESARGPQGCQKLSSVPPLPGRAGAASAHESCSGHRLRPDSEGGGERVRKSQVGLHRSAFPGFGCQQAMIKCCWCREALSSGSGKCIRPRLTHMLPDCPLLASCRPPCRQERQSLKSAWCRHWMSQGIMQLYQCGCSGRAPASAVPRSVLGSLQGPESLCNLPAACSGCSGADLTLDGKAIAARKGNNIDPKGALHVNVNGLVNGHAKGWTGTWVSRSTPGRQGLLANTTCCSGRPTSSSSEAPFG